MPEVCKWETDTLLIEKCSSYLYFLLVYESYRKEMLTIPTCAPWDLPTVLHSIRYHSPNGDRSYGEVLEESMAHCSSSLQNKLPEGTWQWRQMLLFCLACVFVLVLCPQSNPSLSILLSSLLLHSFSLPASSRTFCCGIKYVIRKQKTWYYN